MTTSTLTIHDDIEQGSDEWFKVRRGMVTASIIGSLVTKGAPDATAVNCPTCGAVEGQPCLAAGRKVPTPIKTLHEDRKLEARNLPPVYRLAEGDVAQGIALNLAAERITDFTEESYIGRDMERGMMDEPYARDIYSQSYADVTTTGFMVREYTDDDGRTMRLGYSPDGLVGKLGLIEVKSRLQKIQVRTILSGEVPPENMGQIQCGLLVSEREWCDYVSYCGGMHLWPKRTTVDIDYQEAIRAVGWAMEEKITTIVDAYHEAVTTQELPLTERINHFEGLQF